MARQLARKLGMHPDTNEQGNETSDDDKKWFDRLMEYVDFKESLRGMETEEEQETLRREAREQQLEEATESETMHRDYRYETPYVTGFLYFSFFLRIISTYIFP